MCFTSFTIGTFIICDASEEMGTQDESLNPGLQQTVVSVKITDFSVFNISAFLRTLS